MSQDSILVLWIYFFLSLVISVCCINTKVVIVEMVCISVNFISLFGWLNYFSFTKKSLVIIVLGILMNLLFNHRGQTIIFSIGSYVVTLEAFLWGLTTGGYLYYNLLFFKMFSKLTYEQQIKSMFGFLSPKFSLLLSISLKLVPQCERDLKKIFECNQKKRVKGICTLVGMALEESIETSVSMISRGYTLATKTKHKRKRKAKDLPMLVFLFIFLMGIVFFSQEDMAFTSIHFNVSIKRNTLFVVFYSLWLLCPTFWKIQEEMKWKICRKR